MKVLLVLAAVGVLGGNADQSLDVSEFFDGILDYGSRLTSKIVSMMDDGLIEYVAGPGTIGDLIFSSSLKVPNVDEYVIQQCQYEQKQRNAHMYESLKRNLLGCVRATGNRMDMKVYVGRLIPPIRICLDASRNPSDITQCFINAALPGPRWRAGVDSLAEFIRENVKGLMTNMLATASEGGECALFEVLKARKADSKKFLDCIEEKTEDNSKRDRAINGPESWRNGPETDLDHPRAYGPRVDYPIAGTPWTYGPRYDYPRADGPGADGPGADGPVAEGPGADGPGADGPGADGPGADGPGADGPEADGPAADGHGTVGPGTGGPVTDRPKAVGPRADGRKAGISRF